MGNRAVITTPERKIGIYLHWNGGRDSVEAFLRYCELKEYRTDSYGFARLCQVIGNFFGGTLSLGVMPYTTDAQMDPGDNGIYAIKEWKIVERLRTRFDEDGKPVGMESIPADDEQRGYDLDEMLKEIDARMPSHEQLGEYLDAIEIPTSEVRLGDEVWIQEGFEGAMKAFAVIGFGSDSKVVNGRAVEGLPYVDSIDSWRDNPAGNINNYITAETARIKPRKPAS